MEKNNTLAIIITLMIAIFIETDISYCIPAIGNAPVSLQNRGSVTVTGTGFGLKSPAAPLVWDSCTSDLPLSAHYDSYLPTAAAAGSDYNIQYRPLPYRGISAPNNHVSHVIAGAHAETNSALTYTQGGTVGIGVNMTSHTYYVDYYYRVDPLFDVENNSSYPDNMKELVLSSVQNEFYVTFPNESHGYYSWCTSTVPSSVFTDPLILMREPVEAYLKENIRNAPYGCSGNNIVKHNNPTTQWVKMQWIGKYDEVNDGPTVAFTTLPDGVTTDTSHYGGDITTYEWYAGEYIGYPKKENLNFLGIGGFARVPRENNGINSFRYFTSIYIDTTHARVMMGNNSNLDSCTILEPQVPSSWSDQSVTFDVNLGSLPDSGTGYLFVFDTDNQHNEVGVPVTIENNVSGALSPPENLRIVE